jgi:CelD/BcsL family acetyltransferase involved in cellulose biosynthesis
MEGLPVSTPVAEEWAAIDAAALSEPNTSLFWVRALLAGHVSLSDRRFTMLLRDGGRLISVVPAVIRREKLAGAMSFAVIRPMADLSTAHSDFLRAKDGDRVAEEFIVSLRQLPWRWDALRIGNLLECSPIAGPLLQFLAVSGFRYRVRREQPSYYLDLQPTYDRFLASRSAKFRNYLRRMSRRLEALGRLEVRRAGKDLDTAQAYRDLLEVEERSWKHAHGTAITRIQRQRDFYRQLCDGAVHCGRLHLLVLYLDGRPIAYDLGVTTGGRYSYLKTSFDEAVRAASPATVLRAHLVESLISEGFQTLDFPAEPYEWEEQWASGVRWHRSVLVFNGTFGGRAYRALASLRERKRRAPDQIHHVDPRA